MGEFKSDFLLSVVVPVHNEADNVAPLWEEIQAALADAGTFEGIFVDDGSNDATLEILGSLAARSPNLRILHHRRCCGQSAALASGIRAARGAVIATLDGDGQNDPADIPRLLDEWRQRGSTDLGVLVTGHRRRRKDSGWRKFSSRVANAVRGRLLRDNTPDTGCGLKVFSRELFLKMPYFDHMHRFLPALARRAGCPVLSVEVGHRPRLRGQSKYGTWQRLWVGIWDLLGVMWLQTRASLPEVAEVVPRREGS